MGLIRDLKTQLDQAAEGLPVGLLAGALATLQAVETQLVPELADSGNERAHSARDDLAVVLEELEAARTQFVQASADTVDYAASR